LRGKRGLRVFANRVLRRIFGRKRDEVTRKRKKLYNEELNDLHCSPTIVWVIQLRRMRWVWHVARMGEGRGVYRVWRGTLRERGHWGDPDVDGRIILRWVLRNCDVGVLAGFSWLKIETGGGHL
jgi:PAS domain-containing protein